MDPKAMMEYVGRFQQYVSKSDDLQERLEKCGFSDGRLSSMVAAQDKALSPPLVAQTSNTTPNPAARKFLGNMMQSLLQNLESPADSNEHWLNAVCTLDVYCHHQPDALSIGSHLILAVALIFLELKTNSKTTRRCRDNDGFILSTSIPVNVTKVMLTANEWLGTAGMPPLQWVDVLRQELIILSSLKWRTHIPTAHDWISLIGGRFDILTQSRRSQSIKQICNYCCRWASYLADTYRTTAELSPRVVAHGLLCLSCVASGVLPHDVFMPAAIDSIPDMFKCKCPQIAKLSAHEGVGFVAALVAATGSDFPSLQNDTDIVNDAIMVCPE